MLLDGMPQRLVVADSVDVAPPVSRVCEVSPLLKFRDDFLYGAFRDPDTDGQISNPHVGIFRDAEQDVRMVGQESPRRPRRGG